MLSPGRSNLWRVQASTACTMRMGSGQVCSRLEQMSATKPLLIAQLSQGEAEVSGDVPGMVLRWKSVGGTGDAMPRPLVVLRDVQVFRERREGTENVTDVGEKRGKSGGGAKAHSSDWEGLRSGPQKPGKCRGVCRTTPRLGAVKGTF